MHDLEDRINVGMSNLGRTQLTKAKKVADGINVHAQGHKFASCKEFLEKLCPACQEKKDAGIQIQMWLPNDL